MKFDTIIIGGGLSGLISGIECARNGRKAAIVSGGQSALHFWSGSFEFLGVEGGAEVIENPLERAENLPEEHPYKKMGIAHTARLLSKVPSILTEAGIRTWGSLERNHYRLTPMGFAKPAWLSLEDYFTYSHPSELRGKTAAVINIYSFLDFYPRFLVNGLSRLGVKCIMSEVNVPQLDPLRTSSTEMRSTKMAPYLKGEAVDELARAVETASRGTDMVIMPAVLGMFTDKPVKRLRSHVSRPVYFMATTPASVPGARCQISLIDLFKRLGGTFFPGDKAVRGEFENGRLKHIFTSNFGSIPLEADNFVMSTGSFFGNGLIADINRIYEPVFGLDLYAGERRTDWYRKDLYAPQPYMEYGVLTDDNFHPLHKGRIVENMYAIGALLSGFNALKEGSGAGITLATALRAAEQINRSNNP